MSEWQPRENINNYEDGQKCWLLVSGKVRLGVVNEYPRKKLFQTETGSDEGMQDWGGEIIRVSKFIPIVKPQPPEAE